MEAPPRMNEEIGRRIDRLQISQQGAGAGAPANFAEDPRRFVTAVEAELCCWDAYLERLQVKAATAGSAREQAEEAISELRRHRNFLHERLGALRSGPAEAWSEGRAVRRRGAPTSGEGRQRWRPGSSENGHEYQRLCRFRRFLTNVLE